MGKFLQDRFHDLQNRLAEVIGQLTQRSALVYHRESERVAGMARQIPARIRQSLSHQRELYGARVRQFEQSAGFMVREQETINRGMVKSVLSRAKRLHHREGQSFRKCVSRFDFPKRFRENRLLKKELKDRLALAGERARQVLRNREKELSAHRDLVLARDPEQVLKRGFSLVLDKKKRVVPSKKAFEKITQARLRFHDGETDITRKEET
jgi:exonuclease VII large subunit